MHYVIIPLSIASLLLVSCKPRGNESAVPAATDSTASAVVAKPYPLDTCIVSDEKLGGMGKPHVIVHEGQEIKFCCKSCLPKFEKEPAKYLAKLK